MKPIQELCDFCHNEYTKKDSRKMYCSPKCTNDARNEKVKIKKQLELELRGKIKETIPCKCCNEKFDVPYSHPHKIFCDKKECNQTALNKKENGKPCKVCNNPIPYGRVKRTCSEDCELAWDAIMVEHKKEYNKKYYKENFDIKPPKIVFCDICEKEFETLTNRKYCENQDCIDEGRRKVNAIYMKNYRDTKFKERIDLAEIEEEFYINPLFLKRGSPQINSGAYNL